MDVLHSVALDSIAISNGRISQIPSRFRWSKSLNRLDALRWMSSVSLPLG
jgi:hypothetical protein